MTRFEETQTLHYQNLLAKGYKLCEGDSYNCEKIFDPENSDSRLMCDPCYKEADRCPNCGNIYDDKDHVLVFDSPESPCLSCYQGMADRAHDAMKDGLF